MATGNNLPSAREQYFTMYNDLPWQLDLVHRSNRQWMVQQQQQARNKHKHDISHVSTLIWLCSRLFTSLHCTGNADIQSMLFWRNHLPSVQMYMYISILKPSQGAGSWIGEVQSLDLQWVQLSNHWAIVTHCCYSETKALWFQVARTWETNWGEVSLQWLDRKRGSETGENLPGIGMRLYVKFEVDACRSVNVMLG